MNDLKNEVLPSNGDSCQRSGVASDFSENGGGLSNSGTHFHHDRGAKKKGIVNKSGMVNAGLFGFEQYPGWLKGRVLASMAWVGCIGVAQVPAIEAMTLNPSEEQIEQAVEHGKVLADSRRPPVELYAHFGASEPFNPQGFLMTKLGGIAVMSGHFALRGERPSPRDIERILGEKELQVVVTVYGASPTFARESYVLFKQGDRVIKPARIRTDGMAMPIKGAIEGKTYRAKIVASFDYGSFDPIGETVIAVFPGTGGEENFLVDFSGIP